MSQERRFRQLNIALLCWAHVTVITEAGTFGIHFADTEKREVVRLNNGRIEVKPHAAWDWYPVIDHREIAWVRSQN